MHSSPRQSRGCVCLHSIPMHRGRHDSMPSSRACATLAILTGGPLQLTISLRTAAASGFQPSLLNVCASRRTSLSQARPQPLRSPRTRPARSQSSSRTRRSGGGRSCRQCRPARRKRHGKFNDGFRAFGQASCLAEGGCARNLASSRAALSRRPKCSLTGKGTEGGSPLVGLDAAGSEHPDRRRLMRLTEERSNRQPWEPEELKALFASPIYLEGERPVGGKGEA